MSVDDHGPSVNDVLRSVKVTPRFARESREFTRHASCLRAAMHQVIRAIAFAALVAIGSTACSKYATAPAATPPIAAFGAVRSDAATVCVFRPTRVGAAMTIPMHDNGELVGVTEAYTYFCYFAEPGRHRISVAGGSDAADRVFNLTAGERLFLRHEINIGNDYLLIISKDESATYLDECQYAVVTAVPPEDRVPDPNRLVRAQPL